MLKGGSSKWVKKAGATEGIMGIAGFAFRFHSKLLGVHVRPWLTSVFAIFAFVDDQVLKAADPCSFQALMLLGFLSRTS